MEQLRLHLKDVDFEPSQVNKRLSVGAVLYVSVGDKFFPTDQWYDMLSFNFETWISGLLSFAEHHTDSCVLLFMDGPYQLKLERQSLSVVKAFFYKDHKEQIPQTEIDFADFLASVAKCVRSLATSIYMKDEHHVFRNQIANLGALSKQLDLLSEQGTN